MNALTAIDVLKHPTCGDGADMKEALERAVAALEKQIPKACTLFKDVCECGHGVFPHMEYCDKCGKALAWSK